MHPIVLALRQVGLIEGKLITGFRGYDISRYLKKRGDRVYDELFQKGDFFIANCEFFCQRAIKLGCDPEKIVVLGSGIDCSKSAFTPRRFPEDRQVRIATIGRLIEKKESNTGFARSQILQKLTPTSNKLIHI